MIEHQWKNMPAPPEIEPTEDEEFTFSKLLSPASPKKAQLFNLQMLRQLVDLQKLVPIQMNLPRKQLMLQYDKETLAYQAIN